MLNRYKSLERKKFKERNVQKDKIIDHSTKKKKKKKKKKTQPVLGKANTEFNWEDWGVA